MIEQCFNDPVLHKKLLEKIGVILRRETKVMCSVG